MNLVVAITKLLFDMVSKMFSFKRVLIPFSSGIFYYNDDFSSAYRRYFVFGFLIAEIKR